MEHFDYVSIKKIIQQVKIINKKIFHAPAYGSRVVEEGP